MAWQRALVILSIWTGPWPPHLFLLATATALLIGGWPALSPFPLHAQEKGLPACGVPVPGDDGWEIAEPTAGSAPASKLCELARYLDSTPQDNIHGVVVVQAGRLVFEKYLEGEDQRWGVPLGVTMHGPTVRHDVRAVTNSVISLLVGIAIDRQLIAGVDQLVFDFFPEYGALRTPEKDRILLRHLLTMSSASPGTRTCPTAIWTTASA